MGSGIAEKAEEVGKAQRTASRRESSKACEQSRKEGRLNTKSSKVGQGVPSLKE